ncbi:MAG: UDP-2,3-diacylglucosamine diphosphatase [Nitrospinae bacterium]|nr:UDP-2,3-diacylglucosamine diphosphatase [Nitrospinota bacterium]MCY4381575.1 UDP-2,3-diacylglucosamine diphosphatase [Nitrospinota bacterium]
MSPAPPGLVHFRSVFISDIHLGTKTAQPAALLEFLKVVESDRLYLVGDVIDNWALKRNWYWHQTHNDVIQKLLRKARKGTKVFYIPGNHDEMFRDFCGQHFGRVRVRHDYVHRTADGKKYLVLHGDQFDGVVLYAKWLAHFGDRAYKTAIWVNQRFNKLRRVVGLPYWSLSAYLKRNVKRAVEFISNLEQAVVRAARDAGADGVICGHIHTPDMRMIEGIHYCNDGDWVESCTALVEHMDGRLELIHWNEYKKTLEEEHARSHSDGRLAAAG